MIARQQTHSLTALPSFKMRTWPVDQLCAGITGGTTARFGGFWMTRFAFIDLCVLIFAHVGKRRRYDFFTRGRSCGDYGYFCHSGSKIRMAFSASVVIVLD